MSGWIYLRRKPWTDGVQQCHGFMIFDPLWFQIFGEKFVLHIADKSGYTRDKKGIRFYSGRIGTFSKMISKPME